MMAGTIKDGENIEVLEITLDARFK